MKRRSMHLASLAAATLLSLSTLQASQAQGLDDNSWSEYGSPVFEESFPTTTSVDGMLLDLPAGYFADVRFPPMGDFMLDSEPILLAGLDLLSTP